MLQVQAKFRPPHFAKNRKTSLKAIGAGGAGVGVQALTQISRFLFDILFNPKAFQNFRETPCNFTRMVGLG